MIENVYPLKSRGEQIGGRSRKLPRNIRACGQAGPFPIYIEDYVETYIRRMTESYFPESVGIILVGQVMETEIGRCLFIRGGIGANKICAGDLPSFGEEVWNEVYEKIRLYFPGDEVVGWCIGGPGFRLLKENVFLRAHIDNFADSEKVFFCYESLEKELTIRICSDGGFRVLPGYYIYYERNDEMQNYMLAEELPAPKTGRTQQDDSIEPAAESKRNKKEQEKPVLHKSEKPTALRKDILQLAAIACIIVLIISVMVGTDTLATLKESVLANGKNSGEDTIAYEDETVRENETVPTRDPEELAFGDFDFLEQIVTEETEQQKEAEQQKEPDEIKEPENPELLAEEEISEPTPLPDAETEIAQRPSEPENPDVIEEETITVLAPAEYTSYMVKPGDTLAQICKEEYGSVELLHYICELNQLRDIDSIYVGQELILPKK